jgi:hypothetical protein
MIIDTHTTNKSSSAQDINTLSEQMTTNILKNTPILNFYKSVKREQVSTFLYRKIVDNSSIFSWSKVTDESTVPYGTLLVPYGIHAVHMALWLCHMALVQCQSLKRCVPYGTLCNTSVCRNNIMVM